MAKDLGPYWIVVRDLDLTGERPKVPLATPLLYFNFLIPKLLVTLVASRQFERVGGYSLALLHTRYHVRAADPVRFGKIGLRPAGGGIRVRMIEAHNVFPALAPFALNAHQLLGIYVIAIVGRIVAGVSAARRRGHDAGVSVRGTEQHATALVGISFLPMSPNLSISNLGKLEHP